MLRVEYKQDVAPFDGNPARYQGETYAVADEASAKKYHPMAEIVSHEDGTEFVSATVNEDQPVWYRKRVEMAQADGVELAPLLDGETQRAYDERLEQEAAAQVAGENAEPTSEEGPPAEGETAGEGEPS